MLFRSVFLVSWKIYFVVSMDTKKILTFPVRLKEIADGLGDELWNMLGPISRREEIQQVSEVNFEF